MEGLLNEGEAVFATVRDFTATLFGTPLRLEQVVYYSHHAEVDNAHQILTDLWGGTAAGKSISIRPLGELSWVIYSPEHLEAAGADTVITQPLADRRPGRAPEIRSAS